MRLRSLYTIVGVAWGAVIAAPAMLLLTATVLAAAWLYVFGDNPWPARPWILLVPGLLVAVAILAYTAGLGYRYGSHAEATLPERQAVIRRRATWWILAALIVGLFEVGVAVTRERRQQDERARQTELAANFERLLRERHTIAGIDVVWDRDEESGARIPSQAAIALSGQRVGMYRIDWELTETLLHTPLLVGEERLRLDGGDTTVTVLIDMETARQRYRSEVLDGRGGVLVDGEWPIRVRLRPLLSREEAESISGAERQNLRLGMSALVSEGEGAVPVHFLIE